MKRTTIQPTDVHLSAGYSHAVRVGDTPYISGQVPRNQAGKVVGAGEFEDGTATGRWLGALI